MLDEKSDGKEASAGACNVMGMREMPMAIICSQKLKTFELYALHASSQNFLSY